MDLPQKIQLVIDVANGKQSMTVLREHLDDEVNFVKLAIDHCVQRELSKATAGKAQFRFRLKEHGTETFTDWQPEVSQFAAGMAMGAVRRDHPTAEVSIERQY
jgi:predicted ArsR family transcriptional regulator